MKVAIECVCPFCKSTNYVAVSYHGYQQWLDGKGSVQEIFPDLSPDERELLMTGICGTCWDEIFPPEEDEEEKEFDPLAELLRGVIENG